MSKMGMVGLAIYLCIVYLGYMSKMGMVGLAIYLCIVYLGYMSKMGMVGLAIYPQTAATFNHSCDPNTFAVNVGKVFSLKGLIG